MANAAQRPTGGGQAGIARTVGRIGGVIGCAILLAALLVNPLTLELWKSERALDHRDVFSSFALWSAALGSGLVLAGWALRRAPSRWLARAIVLSIVPVLTIVADRALLAHFGLPLWIFDIDAHFKHRPNAVRLARNGREVVRINSHGYHDDEFPAAKPDGEWRALMLGDSITMGYNVTAGETFSARLEELLAERDVAHRSHQVINAGVAGYAAHQEHHAFRRALRFEPDFVVLGFCLNDVTELFRVQKEFGGTGIDYHGVQQTTSELVGYLTNETGFGRLLQYLNRESSSLEARRRWEDYNVRDLIEGTGDRERYGQAWDVALADLERSYALAREQEIELLLMIFPYTLQLSDPALRGPQRILTEHAREHGVPVLDLADTFRDLIHDPVDLERVRSGETDAKTLRSERHDEISEYYLDSNHFTSEGHRVIAAELFEVLRLRGNIRPGSGPTELDVDGADGY